jgi:hypothetical protein
MPSSSTSGADRNMRSTDEIKNALTGAYLGESGEGEAKTSVTRQTVLQNSTVTYAVYGGSAQYAMGPIDSASPAAMDDRVKAYIASEKANHRNSPDW